MLVTSWIPRLSRDRNKNGKFSINPNNSHKIRADNTKLLTLNSQRTSQTNSKTKFLREMGRKNIKQLRKIRSQLEINSSM